jgi:hypothetical protein
MKASACQKHNTQLVSIINNKVPNAYFASFFRVVTVHNDESG